MVDRCKTCIHSCPKEVAEVVAINGCKSYQTNNVWPYIVSFYFNSDCDFQYADWKELDRCMAYTYDYDVAEECVRKHLETVRNSIPSEPRWEFLVDEIDEVLDNFYKYTYRENGMKSLHIDKDLGNWGFLYQIKRIRPLDSFLLETNDGEQKGLQNITKMLDSKVVQGHNEQNK